MTVGLGPGIMLSCDKEILVQLLMRLVRADLSFL